MELITLSCNQCGAPLEAPPSARFLTCAHCGSRLSVQRTGSAYYTEVMEQVATNTAQIATRVEALDTAQWETCLITWQRTPLTWNKAGAQFVAAGVGVQGNFVAAQSERFPDATRMIRGALIMQQTPEAVAALNNLISRLLQEGWEAIVLASDQWYARSFRRRVTGAR